MKITYKNEITYTVTFTEYEFHQLTDAVAVWADTIPGSDQTEDQKAAISLCRDMWAQKRETQSS